jgi:hypothetical protein
MKATFRIPIEIALLLCIAAVLRSQPIFYHADQDKNAQLAAATAKQVANGAIFSKETQNLDVISKLEIEHTFSTAQVTLAARITAFETWDSVVRGLESTRRRLQAPGQGPTEAEASKQIDHLEKRIEDLQREMEKLKAKAASEDVVKQIQDNLATVAGALKYAQSIPLNATFTTAITKVNDGLDTLTAVYSAFVTGYEARKAVQDQVKKIGASEGDAGQQQFLQLLSLELKHFQWLAQNAARQAVEDGVVLTQITRAENKINTLSATDRARNIQDTLEDLARRAREGPNDDARDARGQLQMLLIALHEASAAQAQGDLPVKLARLRETQEQDRYSILRSGVKVQGAESQLQNVTALIALYYQGGIKPTQVAQFLYNISGLVSLPYIAAK